MPKAKLQAATVGGTADDTEAAFYDALQNGDIDKLVACWADEDDAFCIHPGGPRLVGPAAIRASFEQIFANGAVHATPVHLRKVDSLTSSVHSLLERIEVLTDEGMRHAFVLATNIYHQTAQGWRMVAHHASPGTGNEPLDGSETPQTLH